MQQYGAIPSPKDDRDYKFGSLCGQISEILPYTNLSDEPMKDQEQTSMCGAFAGTSYRYSQEWYQNGNTDLFSCTMLYGADYTYSGEGMYGRTLAKLLINRICKTYVWETLGTKSECKKLFKYYKDNETIKNDFKKYRTSSYYFCDNWTEVLQAIRTTNGCILMLGVYDSWYNDNEVSGLIGKNAGKLHGYHFVFAKDYVKKDNGAYRIRFKNSWGAYWGDSGYGYIDTDTNDFEEAFAIVDDVEEVKRKMYSDIKQDAWYYESVKKVSEAGLMKGYEDNTFKPDKPITRAEMATILCRLKNL